MVGMDQSITRQYSLQRAVDALAAPCSLQPKFLCLSCFVATAMTVRAGLVCKHRVG